MVEDYSVSWNEVKNLVDEFIKDHDEKGSMYDIECAVKKAWKTLYADLRKKYNK